MMSGDVLMLSLTSRCGGSLAAVMSQGVLLLSLTSSAEPMPTKNNDPAAARPLPPAAKEQHGLCAVLLSAVNGPAPWDVVLLSRPGRGVFFRPFLPVVTDVPFASMSMGAAS